MDDCRLLCSARQKQKIAMKVKKISNKKFLKYYTSYKTNFTKNVKAHQEKISTKQNSIMLHQIQNLQGN